MIKVYWQSDKQDIIRVDFYMNWTYEQVIESLDQVLEMADTSKPKSFCGLIIDNTRDRNLPPPNAILYARKFVTQVDFPVAILSAGKGIAIAQSIISLALRLTGSQARIRIVDSDQKALDYLYSHCRIMVEW